MKTILFLLIFIIGCIPAYADFQDVVQSQPLLYKFTSVGTVTTVKTTAGFLHTLVVEGGTTSPINIYDGQGATAAQIAGFTTTNAIQTYTFDIGFSSGCVVQTNGALQFTVSYL